MSTLNATTLEHEESRLLAAATAARSERRNRPTAFLLSAGVLLVIALLWLAVTFMAYRAARATMLSQQAQAATIAKNVSDVRTLKAAASADTGPRLNEQEGAIRSRLIEIGVAAGLTRENITPRALTRVPKRDLGSVLMTAGFEARDPALGPLLGWLERAVAQMPGIEVYKIVIRPESQQWFMQVSFLRWEKPEVK